MRSRTPSLPRFRFRPQSPEMCKNPRRFVSAQDLYHYQSTESMNDVALDDIYERSKTPEPESRGLIREIVETEITLWTFAASGFLAYACRQKKYLIFVLFIAAPLYFSATVFFSWLLAVFMAAGRLLAFKSSTRPETPDDSWVFKSNPVSRKSSIGSRSSLDSTSDDSANNNYFWRRRSFRRSLNYNYTKTRK